jgi:hypothetical protein
MWHAWERREKCTMGSEWILGRLAWGCGLDLTSSGQGPVADSLSAVMNLRVLAPRT